MDIKGDIRHTKDGWIAESDIHRYINLISHSRRSVLEYGQRYPDLLSLRRYIQFPGQGQRPIPCVNLIGLCYLLDHMKNPKSVALRKHIRHLGNAFDIASINEWSVYWDGTQTLRSRNYAESRARDRLKSKLGGQEEVPVFNRHQRIIGRIDLLTDQYVIEVKNGKDWRKGLGQLSVYGQLYPDREKVLWIYTEIAPTLLDDIKQFCAPLKIIVRTDLV